MNSNERSKTKHMKKLIKRPVKSFLEIMPSGSDIILTNIKSSEISAIAAKLTGSFRTEKVTLVSGTADNPKAMTGYRVTKN